VSTAFPQLETARLTLRPFALADIDELHCLWLDPQVRKYLWDDQLISREQAAEVVASSLASFAEQGYGFWRGQLREAAGLCGFCGLRQFGEPPEVEILYGLLPQYWGRGLVVEAARAVLRYGFETAGLKRIYAGADPPNAASFRVMERLGMVFSHRATINGLAAIYYVLERSTCYGGEPEMLRA
jgi:ribosomal-protein-alanine N-acetyltransferase